MSGRARRALLLAVICYVPLLLTRPGMVAADTKQFLYLDPFWLLGRAASLWDPSAGLGTVTHQNIGYLFPMGPWFAGFHALGVPTWIAQRLWLGTILFAASTGVVALSRRLGLAASASMAGALLYALSPYSLAYVGRTSALLLPFAGLPWLIALAIDAVRSQRWAPAAVFALAVTLIGGTNASSLVFVGLGPIVWLAWSWWPGREHTRREVLAAVARIGVLTTVTQLWWLAGLRTQGAYGLPILSLTETVSTVAQTSSAAEIVRHLGYWYFYGRDGVGAWTDAAHLYLQRPALIVLSFLLPALGLLAACCVRWRHRVPFVALLLLGLVIGIGPHPYDETTPLGAGLKAASSGSAVGLALRNSPRAVPLLALALAMLVTAALHAIGLRVAASERLDRRAPVVASVAVAVLAVANLPPLWTGGLVQPQLMRPEALPSWWTDATRALDADGTTTRVLELPGQDFGAYRWGQTQDLLTRGLMTRRWVGRELIPFGSPQSADLLRALDRRFQEGVSDPAAIAPIARLMGVGDVLLRSDAQYERYRTPRPRRTWAQVTDPVPPGLGDPVAYGPAVANRAIPEQPLLDEVELATPVDAPDPPPVATFAVDDPVAIVRARSTTGAVVVDGDGEGVVDAAETGFVDGHRLVVQPASYVHDTSALDAALSGADLVLTDTNRRRASRWGTLRENSGYTEQAGETPLVRDPKDARLEVFPDAGDDTRSVTELVPDGPGVAVTAVRASSYGNPVTYTPEDRPDNVVDGDSRTAWKVGAFDEVRGERIRIDLASTVTADHVVLVQPVTGVNERWVTAVTLTFFDDAGRAVGSQRADLADVSRTVEGQVVAFGERSFRSIEVRVDDANIPRLAFNTGLSPVGFSEVQIPGVAPMRQAVRLPTATVGRPAASSAGRLSMVLTRLRADAAEPVRADPERNIDRIVNVPDDRTFTLSGQVRLSDRATDAVVDASLGRPDATAGGVSAVSSDRVAGQRDAGAWAAVDGDPATAWSPGFLGQQGRWIEVTAPAPVTFDHLDLVTVDDGRHSVPTRLAISADGAAPIEVDVPSRTGGRIALPSAVTATTVRVTIAAADEHLTPDFYSGRLVATPVAIAELGIAGMQAPPTPAAVPSTCRRDLVSIDGDALAVRLDGSTTDALAGRPLRIVGCDGQPLSISLTTGRHEVRTAIGQDAGWDLDRLVLTGAGAPAAVGSAPETTVTHEGLDDATIRVSDATGPFWLVFGQSHSDGWAATIDGQGDLGRSSVVDGYANGWRIDPKGAADLVVHVRWTPERVVLAGIAVSTFGVGACLAIVVVALVRRRRWWSAGPPAGVGLVTPWWAPGPPRAAVPSLGWSVVVAAAATVIGGVAAGLAVGLATFVGLRVRHGRVVVATVPWLALGPVALFVAAKQVRNDFVVGVEWPDAMDPSHLIVLTAVLMLGAEVVVRSRRRARSVPGADARDRSGPLDANDPMEDRQVT